MPNLASHATVLSCAHCSTPLVVWSDSGADALIKWPRIHMEPLRCAMCGVAASHPRWVVWPLASREEKLRVTVQSALRTLLYGTVVLTLVTVALWACFYHNPASVVHRIPRGWVFGPLIAGVYGGIFLLCFRKWVGWTLSSGVREIDRRTAGSSFVTVKRPVVGDMIPVELIGVDAKPARCGSDNNRRCCVNAGRHTLRVAVTRVWHGAATTEFNLETEPGKMYEISPRRAGEHYRVLVEEVAGAAGTAAPVVVVRGRFGSKAGVAIVEFEPERAE